MSLSKVRSLLYRLARLLGDVNAVEKGKVPQRVERHIVGRMFGRNIFGGDFRSARLQQSPSASMQSALIDESVLKEVREFASSLSERLGELALSSKDAGDLQAAIATLETQAGAPAPSKRLLLEAMASCRNILEGTAGSLVVSGLIAHVDKIAGLFR
jgi:hypothetical protein